MPRKKKNGERPGFGTRLRGLRQAAGYTQPTPLRKKAPKVDSRLQRRMKQIERMNPKEKRQVLQILDALIEREQLRASKG